MLKILIKFILLWILLTLKPTFRNENRKSSGRSKSANQSAFAKSWNWIRFLETFKNIQLFLVFPKNLLEKHFFQFSTLTDPKWSEIRFGIVGQNEWKTFSFKLVGWLSDIGPHHLAFWNRLVVIQSNIINKGFHAKASWRKPPHRTNDWKNS